MPHPSHSSSDFHLEVTAGQAPPDLRTAVVCRRIADTLGVGVCVVIASEASSARQRLHATDEVAAWLDDRQYVLGQGPTVDALTTRMPVVVPDTNAPQVLGRWPGFTQEIIGRPVRAVFAFPLLVADAVLGTVQLHRGQPQDLALTQLAAIADLLGDLLTAILDDHTNDVTLNAGVVDDGSARVAMAVGMVAVQVCTTLPNALARLRGTAYTTNRPMGDVADDVLNRRLHYRPT